MFMANLGLLREGGAMAKSEQGDGGSKAGCLQDTMDGILAEKDGGT